MHIYPDTYTHTLLSSLSVELHIFRCGVLDQPIPSMPVNIHILGAGAMGQLVGHELVLALGTRVNPILLMRSPQALGAYIKNYKSRVGVTSTDYDGGVQKHYHNLQAFCSPRQFNGPIENLILLTKAHCSTSALSKYVGKITPATNILLLQNGMGVYNQLVERYFADPATRPKFFQGITTHGAVRVNPHLVAHLGNGDIKVAPIDHQMDTPPEFIKLMMESSVLNTSYLPYSQLLVAQLEKLVVNAVINPLTAIHNCRNGDLLKSSQIKRMMDKIVAELCDIINKAYPELAHIPEAQTVLHPQKLVQTVRQVCESTADNSSSMREDILHLRTTEIDFITGHLLRLAKHHKVWSNTNWLLREMVQGKLELNRALELGAVKMIMNNQ